MKTNTLAAICGSIAVAATTAALANDPAPPDGALEAVYEDFARSGVFDLELSNAKANELVSQGLFSGNPQLVRLTLRAMGAHALSRGAGTVVERNFAVVPQIKEFLIALWHTRVAEEGHINLLGDDPQDVSRQVQAAFAAGENLWAATVAFTPDWMLIPRVLAANFPGDDDVHALLWEFDSLTQAPTHPVGWILKVFNEGRFRTPEVDQLRIDGVDADDHFTFVEAAKGLAFSRPERGLEALISALHNNNRPERETLLVDAIVSYGPEAIPLLNGEGLEHISSKIFTGGP